MRVAAVDVIIICPKPNVSISMMSVGRDGDGDDDPGDIRYWREEGRVSAEEMARATVRNTGGRVFVWDGGYLLRRFDNDK